MSAPLQTRTQFSVYSAQIRGALNNGPDWGTSGSTLATVGSSAGGASGDTVATISPIVLTTPGTPSATSTIANSGTPSANDVATIVGKLNTVIALLRNLNS
jgi:hypothetical protein